MKLKRRPPRVVREYQLPSEWDLFHYDGPQPERDSKAQLVNLKLVAPADMRREWGKKRTYWLTWSRKDQALLYDRSPVRCCGKLYADPERATVLEEVLALLSTKYQAFSN